LNPNQPKNKQENTFPQQQQNKMAIITCRSCSP